MPRGGDRRSKPRALRVLQGNPSKRPLNEHEPQPAPLFDLTPPVGLDYYGKQTWERNAPKLLKLGILSEVDADALYAYCDAYSQLRRCQTVLKLTFKQWLKVNGLDGTEDGKLDLFASYLAVQRAANVDRKAARLDIRLYASAFGMTPQGRAGLSTKTEAPADPFAEQFDDRHTG